ncbi:MAG: DUF3501 family protein [Acidimicrobiales bacterium]
MPGVSLTLADIVEPREYEREREAFRARVIELKRLRRLGIGPFVSVVFENVTTMRFQIQEMARAEKMTTDAQIQAELDIYNPLIPARGELSFTMFIELTSEAELREWLPKLVGVERAVSLRIGEMAPKQPLEVVPALVDAAHGDQLTRDEVTAAVHYARLALDPGQQERFVAGPAAIAIGHRAYSYETTIEQATRESIAADW